MAPERFLCAAMLSVIWVTVHMRVAPRPEAGGYDHGVNPELCCQLFRLIQGEVGAGVTVRGV